MLDDEQDFEMIAEINMAPLVDVVFVLLIIFMTTAPLMQRGIDVDLPEAATNNLSADERVNVDISKEGVIYINEEKIRDDQLLAILETHKIKNPEITVYLKSDKHIEYGKVIFVMDSVKQAGIDKLGMVTEALGK